jgi:hypothetical protein
VPPITEMLAAATGSAVKPATNDTLRLTDDATHDDAPSRQDLLQRAAARGLRATWDSLALPPSDPILGAKMQPRVAERRARFRKIVKVALGACVAFCLVATAATALSSNTPTSEPRRTASKTAPARGIVPVEKLEVATRTKASSHVTAAVRPAPTPRKKRR